MDHRMDDRKETAISVIRILEKVTNGNGAGRLVMDYYLEEISWYSLTEKERRTVETTARAFAKALREAGFIEGKERK